MARFRLNGSVRADCFLRMMQSGEELLVAEIQEELDSIDEVRATDASWLTASVDVALVLGITPEQWAEAYRKTAEYYASIGMELK